ncbi:MAG: hypothetical protein GXC94_02080 [Comamonadaceae bacterium]|nr:hypothetical protein [Comamonadaceae bacterium]
MSNQPRPQVQQGRSQAPQSTVSARQGSYVSSLPVGNPELAGLMQGLSAFNPALQNLAQAEARRSDQLDQLQAPEAAAQAKAEAQRLEDPVAALYQPTPAAPSNVRPALAPSYLRELNAGTAQRAAQRINADTAEAYFQAVDQPDFKLDTFLAERRRQALAGVADNTAAAVLGGHLDNLDTHLRDDYQRRQVKKLEETNNSILFQDAGDRFSTDLTADGVALEWAGFETRAAGLGKTPKEAATLLLRQLMANSEKLGGSPELFDAFDRRLADGTTLRSKNPELSAQVDSARQHAATIRDHRIEQENAHSNGKTLDDLYRMIDTGQAAQVTPELLLPHFHKGGAIKSPEQFASILNQARDRAMKDHAATAFDGYADAGMLALLPDNVQGEIATRRLGPALLAMTDRIRAGDAAGASDAMTETVRQVLRWGGSKPVAELTRFVEANLVTVPSAGGPPPAFQALSAMYRALAVAPALRSQYFNEDAQQLLEAYQAHADGGADTKGAYEAAYRTIDPAAKKRAEEFAKTPEYQKLVSDKVAKHVEGSSMFPTWIGGNGRPENVALLKAEGALQLRSMLSRNPNLSESQIEAQLSSWYKNNYVLDTTSQMAVKVPPGLGGADAQTALSEFTARLAKDASLSDRSDGTWTVQLSPLGAEGKYAVQLALDGIPKKSVPVVMDLATEIKRVAARRVLTPEDKQQLGAYLAAHKKDGSVLDIPPEVMAKGEAMGLVTGSALDAWKDKQSSSIKDRLKRHPQFGFGTNGTGPLQFTNTTSTNALDIRTTASVATEFLKDFNGSLRPYGGHDPQFLAASLVAMGEGVALTAYDDPARGAGKNIGMGYNLAANKATVDADLKAAGVPESRIESVKAGTLSLTQDQAKRLVMVALPRYMKQTEAVAESVAPGLWSSMTAQQKAVMVDIAYQTGNPKSFVKAWNALKDNDQDAFLAETKTYFTNQAGERQEDTRRAGLRDALLRGPTFWSQRLAEAGRLPGNKLQAMALK